MNSFSKQLPKAAILDFDGTLSTLRCGWEKVMRPLMLEMINPAEPDDPKLGAEVDRYIDESTGIQTVYQMRWLAEQVKKRGANPEQHDEWWYKDEYNRRLMCEVQNRIDSVASGRVSPEHYLIRGSAAFLAMLRTAGISLYVASGTDDVNVRKEVEVLGLTSCFESILGAPYRQAACSKEAVIRRLMDEKGFSGESLLVIGDGKVEIGLGKAAGGRTIGVASNEETRCGINPVKEMRLKNAGADYIIGDYTDLGAIREWIGLQ